MPEVLSALELTFRDAAAEDRAFLSELYISTRLEELSVTGWSPEMIRAFLQQQFEAQTAHYEQHYLSHGAIFRIILEHGHPIGRFYTFEGSDEIRVVDIALVPEARGRGIGTAILKDLLSKSNKPVTIHVEKQNPAMRLYQRLGFSRIGEHGYYDLMECRPAAVS
ncbi:GNAT family N-acetyltransferase [Roseimicrobium sp. ORNL1]|uniref:GNAT family N-acetyltransferase n=1 Tax=Roseimicrobium sp. ORNL1 TaxID=2711231 RepID=UPI00197F7510|nr:GNAT family N-acetyltransferase [Roseimicrobium sp. ORNL1]